MGYQTSYTGTEKVVLTNPDYWIEIKTCLSRAELQRAEQVLSSNATVNSGGKTSISPDVVEYRNSMMTASLVNWNLDDDNGNILPLRVGVGILSGPDFERVWLRVDELNTMPSGPEAAQFPSESVSGSEGARGGATEPGEVPA